MDNLDIPQKGGDLKIHISRVPAKFNEDIVERILSESLLPGNGDEKGDVSGAITVELIYPREDESSNVNSDRKGLPSEDKVPEEEDPNDKTSSAEKEHRGFGFVTFESQEIYEKALALEKIKGGRKPTSKKLHTMYLRAYATAEEDMNLCYLWSQNRCPYGDDCKFNHIGTGSCLVTKQEGSKEKKKGKCFAYKKGKCTKGDSCPFSHDFEPAVKAKSNDKHEERREIPKSEKDCINWKTKGKCRKLDTCPYRHDPAVLKKALESKKRKRQLQNGEDGDGSNIKKQKQPLSVRVFGMAYDTTEEDIREFFRDCGKIQTVSFPTFEDSGRSKGYCGVWFSSPKAVAKAIELDGQELHGRWLSIQAGKMYLRQWEENHKKTPSMVQASS